MKVRGPQRRCKGVAKKFLQKRVCKTGLKRLLKTLAVQALWDPNPFSFVNNGPFWHGQKMFVKTMFFVPGSNSADEKTCFSFWVRKLWQPLKPSKFKSQVNPPKGFGPGTKNMVFTSIFART